MRIVPAPRALFSGNSVFAILSTGISSLGNIVIQFAVAFFLTTQQFGEFALGSSTIILILGLGRAVVGNTDMLRGAPEHDRKPIAAAYALAALTIVAGGITVAIGFTAGIDLLSTVGLAFAVSSIFVIQDAARFRAFRTHRAKVAFLSDTVALVAVLLGVGVLAVFRAPPTGYIAIWGLSTLIGFAVLVVPLRYRPATTGPQWLLEHKDLVLPSTGEFLLQSGLPYALNWLIIATGGLGALAGYRLIQLIFALVANLAQGIDAVVLPRLVDSRDPRRARTLTYLQGVVILGISGLLVAAVILTPAEIATTLFGTTWNAMMPFVAAGALHGAVNALAIPIYSLLRLVGGAKLSFLIRTISVTVSLAAVAVTTPAWGALGVAWSMAIVATLAYVWRATSALGTLGTLSATNRLIPAR